MSVLAIALSLLLGGGQAVDPGNGGARTGSRLDPDQRAIPNADTSKADMTLYRLIECAVARKGGRMRQLVDTRSEAEFQSAYGALGDVQRCSLDAYVAEEADTVNFTADRGTVRGYVAEVFLKRDKPRVAGLAPLALQHVYLRDWYPMTGRAQAVDEMAVCVADINPQGIVALIATEIGSKDQKAAIKPLLPSIGLCLSKTVRLTTNALGLRTALAEALYHRVYDAPPVATEGTAK